MVTPRSVSCDTGNSSAILMPSTAYGSADADRLTGSPHAIVASTSASSTRLSSSISRSGAAMPAGVRGHVAHLCNRPPGGTSGVLYGKLPARLGEAVRRRRRASIRTSARRWDLLLSPCGAMYSVTLSRLPKTDRNIAKCVVSGQIMDERDLSKVPIYKLIHRPEDA
jgi:hypothetical protein